jgi:purine-binding chemotaxis protein CheW
MSAREERERSIDVAEVVVFMLGPQRYALPIERVQEIQQIVAMNEVPHKMPGLVGVINLRGAVVPAIDLRQLLGMERLPYALQTPMIIIRARGALAALIVDQVDDVVEVPHGAIQSPDEIYELAERMLGVCRLDAELVFVLDPDKLLPERVSGIVGAVAEDGGSRVDATPEPEPPVAPTRKPRRASGKSSAATRKKAD